MPTISASTWNASYWNRALADDFDSSINNISQALSRLEGVELASSSSSSTRIDGTLTNGGSLYAIGRSLGTSSAVISQLVVNSRPDLFLDIRGSFNDYSGRITYLKMVVADLGVTFSGSLSFSGSSVSGTASQVTASLGSKSFTVDGSFNYTSAGWTGTVTRLLLTDGSQSFEASGGSWSYSSLMPLTTHSTLMYTLASGSETQNGGSEGDLFTGSAGNDTISGGSGVDTIRYSGSSSSAQITTLVTGQVRVVTPYAGTDTLSSIERIEFTDKGYAFDTTGSAGTGAKFITVAFGRGQISKYLSVGLQYLDSGWSVQGLSELVSNSGLLDRMVGSPSNQAFVKHVFQNTLSRLPTSAEMSAFESMLSTGAQTKASLLALAAAYVPETTAGLIPSDGITITGVAYDLG
jgi:hypothetical protein